VNLWGGRFREVPAEALKRFNDSFAFDRRLLEEDVRGSIAWAGALRRCGVLTRPEEQQIATALAEMLVESNQLQRRADAPNDASSNGGPASARQDQPPSYPLSSCSHPKAGWEPALDGEAEDIHSWVESRLRDKIGPLAGKLHTGRSRNDQVATDLKLFLRNAFNEARHGALALATVLTNVAEREADTVMPGYTHLQQAELITFGHWSLAYVEMLLRDADRINAAANRADECPLGAGALAGTPLEVDRQALASALEFSRPAANSLDAVSDRDAAADYLYCVTVFFSHLSRLAEDLILFSTREFSFVELPDAYATGSSRMPQKRNPDVLELVRGHAGRMIGELAGLLALLKGLPLAYNKDLQLDKEPLFRTRDLVAVAIPALAGLLGGLQVKRDTLRSACTDDSLLATQLADAMTRRGVPFRDAHEIVGRRLVEAQSAGLTLLELGASEQIAEEDLQGLDIQHSVAKKSAFGGTSPMRVRAAAAAARERIAAAAGLSKEIAR
jgi:argininosuccinate lyase